MLRKGIDRRVFCRGCCASQRKQPSGSEMEAIKEVMVDDDCSDRGRQRRNQDETNVLIK